MMQPTAVPQAQSSEASNGRPISWGTLAALVEARVLPALMAALNTVDLAHMAAAEVNAALLHPIDVLTQPWVVRKLARIFTRVQAAKLTHQSTPAAVPSFGQHGVPSPRLSNPGARHSSEVSGSCFGVSRIHALMHTAAQDYGRCVPIIPLSSVETLTAKTRLVSFLGIRLPPRAATPPVPSPPEPAEEAATVVADTIPQAEECVYVAPPGVDADTFFSLPEAMQRDIMLQHGMQPRRGSATDTAAADRSSISSTTGDNNSSSSYDPAVLAALPNDIRAEMLQAERRQVHMFCTV